LDACILWNTLPFRKRLLEEEEKVTVSKKSKVLVLLSTHKNWLTMEQSPP